MQNTGEQAPTINSAPSLFHSFVAPTPGTAPVNTPGWSPKGPVENGRWTGQVGAITPRPTGEDANIAPTAYAPYRDNAPLVSSQAFENQVMSADPVMQVFPVTPYTGVSLISNPRVRPPEPSFAPRTPDTYRFFRHMHFGHKRNLTGRSGSPPASNPLYQAAQSVAAKGMQVSFPTRRNTYYITPPPRDVMIADAVPEFQVPSYVYNPQDTVWPGQGTNGTYRLD